MVLLSRMDPQNNWQTELEQLLERAADVGAKHDVDVDSFMRAAWAAYLESRPGMREQIEELQMREQLEAIRRSGRMGQA